MKTYTTVQGDMWDSIAYKMLGSCSYTDKLMIVNQEHLHTFVFPAGVVLSLPEITVSRVNTLPPWKRVSR